MTSKMKSLHLKCKTKTGQHLIESLTDQDTVQELKAILSSLTGILSEKLKILSGYPPKYLDLTNSKQKLGTIFNQTMETLIIEEINEKTEVKKSTIKLFTTSSENSQSSTSQTTLFYEGRLQRRPVPANNSCLFTSVYYCISNGEFSETSARALRTIIAETVAKDPDLYNEGFLAKSNRLYCSWILNDEHWGGAIELSILSKHFKIEIVAIDTQNSRLNRFGEDMNYDKRIVLIYDGIHYDPVVLEHLESATLKTRPQTIFKTIGDNILTMALELAQEAKASHQYTDVQNFTLKCLECNTGLKGQAAARQHAKTTGHINFDEIN